MSDEEVKQKRGIGSLLGALMTVGSITVLSRILGLARDIVIARMIGAGLGADAFFVAFRIPNFLRRLFAEGAFSQAFVPVLSEYRVKREFADVRDLVAHAAGALGAVLLVVSAIGMMTAPWIISVFAPGFSGGEGTRHALASDMLRITFPYLLFISLAALAGGILNSYERFAVPAFTPLLLNISMITCALWLAPRFEEPAMALAWGVAFGGAAQLAIQFPALYRLKLLVRPSLNFAHVGVRRIARLMGPAMFGASVAQVNLLVNTLLASFLVAGSVSWLYFADRLLEFPLGVFGVALGTVILPRLSAQHAAGSSSAFRRTLDWSLRLGMLVTVPAAVALYVLAEPILATLFQYGAFQPRDVAMSAAALKAYAPGLLALVAIKILAPAYFSRQDTRTPVRFGVIAVVVNMVFSVTLVWHLAHVGLALAITISTIVNAGLLYRGLILRDVYAPEQGWARVLAIGIAASVIMGIGLHHFAGDAELWYASGLIERGTRLAMLVAGGALVYALALIGFGVRPRELAPPASASASSD